MRKALERLILKCKLVPPCELKDRIDKAVAKGPVSLVIYPIVSNRILVLWLVHLLPDHVKLPSLSSKVTVSPSRQFITVSEPNAIQTAWVLINLLPVLIQEQNAKSTRAANSKVQARLTRRTSSKDKKSTIG